MLHTLMIKAYGIVNEGPKRHTKTTTLRETGEKANDATTCNNNFNIDRRSDDFCQLLFDERQFKHFGTGF